MEIKRESFITGNYYYINQNNHTEWILRFYEFGEDDLIKSNAHISINKQGCGRFHGFNQNGWGHLNYITELRKATMEEIQWLLECEKIGGFIERAECTTSPQYELY